MLSMHILVVEDDSETASYLSKGLQEAGHSVDVAPDGLEGQHLATQGHYDVLIVDRMLPKVDGLSLIKALRAADNTVPVLILSALGQVDDRVEGLRSGGDDYLTKPFAFSELQARVEALLRRRDPQATQTEFTVADLQLNLLTREVSRAGQSINLQPREFRLLEFLMRHSGQVVTRTMLLEGVWDYNFDPQTNVIDVHVSRLRAKVDRDFNSPLIHTVRGAGYMIRSDHTDA